MVNGNEILDLLYKPMSDERVLNVMEQLGMEVPLLDEKYELEERVVSRSTDEQILFEFKEIDGHSADGIPVLSAIEAKKSGLASLPFNLQYNDDYKTCCSKLNQNADFQVSFRKTIKIWIINFKNFKTIITIHFTNENNTEIKFFKIYLGTDTSFLETCIPNEE